MQSTKPKRKSRFSNYEKATEREFRLWVYPDGTKMPRATIEARIWMANLKNRTYPSP
jgi:hypothetical protein